MIWSLIILSILAISVFLAVRSMHDFQEDPARAGLEYGLFFIQKPGALITLLPTLYSQLLKERLIVSFERLNRGGKIALVWYAPKLIAGKYDKELGLVEIDDYTNKTDRKNVSVLEFKPTQVTDSTVRTVATVSASEDAQIEQVWWQLVIQPASPVWTEKLSHFIWHGSFGQESVKEGNQFYGVARLVVVGENSRKREEYWLKASQQAKASGFEPLRSVYTSAQKLQYHSKRLLPIAQVIKTQLAASEVVQFLRIQQG